MSDFVFHREHLHLNFSFGLTTTAAAMLDGMISYHSVITSSVIFI